MSCRGARRSTSDGGPLERAEWLKFVALFFNKEDLANTLYEQLVANYAQYEQSAARAVEGASRAHTAHAVDCSAESYDAGLVTCLACAANAPYGFRAHSLCKRLTEWPEINSLLCRGIREIHCSQRGDPSPAACPLRMAC